MLFASIFSPKTKEKTVFGFLRAVLGHAYFDCDRPQSSLKHRSSRGHLSVPGRFSGRLMSLYNEPYKDMSRGDSGSGDAKGVPRYQRLFFLFFCGGRPDCAKKD